MNPTLSNFPFKPTSYSSNPLNLPTLGNPLAGITPGPKSTVPTSSVAGTNMPTTNTPRNTSVSSPTKQTTTKQAVAPTYQQPVPGYNPPAVNLKIDSTIPSDALKTTPNTTGMSEQRKSYQQNVLTSKYAAEEEKLLSDIMNLRTGIAGLKGTQAQEYATAETNPTGFGGGALGTSLQRLSKDQALELNARTGQLNAYLDNLELYQGYRPKTIGSPQIDDATGEAFVYLQDPTTGEIVTQSLGQVTTPNPAANYQKVGDAIIDPATGQVIYQAPQEGYTLGKDQVRYDAQGRPVAYGVSGITSTEAGNLSPLTQAIMAGTGSMKDLTPTLKAQVITEMHSIGYNPKQVINDKLSNLVELWKNMPEDQKGYLQGRKFWASSTVPAVGEFNSARELLTREVARLNDVGVLSDQDVAAYTNAMPARTDSSLAVVQGKLKGLNVASTGKSAGTSYPVGTEVKLDNGKTARMTPNGWVDPFTGAKIDVE